MGQGFKICYNRREVENPNRKTKHFQDWECNSRKGADYE